jgi:hypothetical protein
MKRAVPMALFLLCILMPAFGAAEAYDNYGAIAYSGSTGTWGASYDFGSRSEAENAALRACKSGDCEIQVWFMNACGALARADNGSLGWAWASASSAEAEALVLSECGRRGSNCRIICWACTSR